MKKIILFFLLAFLMVAVYSNPISIPPKLIFSEIYFSGNDWVMELVFSGEYEGENLDSIRIETSWGTALFKPGIYPSNGDTLLITSDSLLSPLQINKSGDYINAYEQIDGTSYWNWNDNYGSNTIRFGNMDGAKCTKPYVNQSLVLLNIDYSTPEGGGNLYWLVKENSPTLGTHINECTTKDTISGSVKDKFDVPIPGAQIDYGANFTSLPMIYTDASGEFSNIPMYSRIYDSRIILGDSILADVTMKVEFDTTNEFTFKLENYIYSSVKPSLSKGACISHFPNPVRSSTTFYIDLSGVSFKSGVIKIYNTQGQIIKILPIPYTKKSEVVWKPDYNHIDDGVYFYQLDIDGKEVAYNKMLVVK